MMDHQQRLTVFLSVGMMAMLSTSNGVTMAFVLSPLSSLTTHRNNQPGVAVSTRPAFSIAPAGAAAPAASSRTSTNTLLPRFLFGSLFESKDENPDEGDLAKYSNLPSSGEKFEALSEYIRLWAALFEDEEKKRMGLTTPVKVFPSITSSDTTTSSSVRIVFQKTKTGDNYNQGSKSSERETNDDGPKKKKKPKLEGGVEVLVEAFDGGNMIVRARRTEFDEDTLIKEMSEETILKELKKAMGVWRRDNKK
jgi:hypothetical protein